LIFIFSSPHNYLLHFFPVHFCILINVKSPKSARTPKKLKDIPERGKFACWPGHKVVGINGKMASVCFCDLFYFLFFGLLLPLHTKQPKKERPGKNLMDNVHILAKRTLQPKIASQVSVWVLRMRHVCKLCPNVSFVTFYVTSGLSDAAIYK